MSDDAVRRLAARTGLSPEWVDYSGGKRPVPVDVLRRILAALGLPCGTREDLAASEAQLRRQRGRGAPAFLTAVVGEAISLPAAAARCSKTARLAHEDGTTNDISLRTRDDRLQLPPIAVAGYHHVEIGDVRIDLAVAPPRCHTIEDVAGDARLWGLAVQVYGLHRPGDGGIGDTSAVAALAEAAARLGADALALSPVHALFAADPSHYSPYAPSTRLFHNPLYADPAVLFGQEKVARAVDALRLSDELRRLETATLIDWPAAARAKMAIYRRLFDDALPDGNGKGSPCARDFAQFVTVGGDLLEQHARFETLHAKFLADGPNNWSWRAWPAGYRDPANAAVEQFAAAHRRDVQFHKFLQWLADRAFAAAQTQARGSGMKIGLIADLAVAMDGSGSHAWSRQNDVLVGLNVGAPPDEFNQHGQNWGLTAFSPRALVAGGFAPLIATLRACMRNAGGVRIDHLMALRRLWLIPEGAAPHEGAYLRYPLDDLLRIVALESHRQQTIVIGEDLGTVPAGFRPRLNKAGIYGMRVLWFERRREHFRPPGAWPQNVAAMTSTHDLPTVAGWWRGADIDTRRDAHLIEDKDAAAMREQRAQDRRALWAALRRANVASGAPPAPEDSAPVVDAAVDFVACARSRLALIPLEDALGLVDQPNMPGTVDEHPNWRRRLERPADELLAAPRARVRLETVDRYRR